jgi:ribosomal protein S3
MTCSKLVDVLNEQLGTRILYRQVEKQFIRRYLTNELGAEHVGLVNYFMGMLQLAEAGKLDEVTNEVEKVLGRKGKNIEQFVKETSSMFCP